MPRDHCSVVATEGTAAQLVRGLSFTPRGAKPLSGAYQVTGSTRTKLATYGLASCDKALGAVRAGGASMRTTDD